jgi:hypothetical protein
LVPAEIIPSPTVEQQPNQTEPDIELPLSLPQRPTDVDILQDLEEDDIMTVPSEICILKKFFNKFFFNRNRNSINQIRFT